ACKMRDPKVNIPQCVVVTKSRINVSFLFGAFEGGVVDINVNISVVEGAVDPSPISSVREQGYLWIEKSIREVMPGEQEMVVAPSVMIAQTDARHYTEVSQNIYRFCPLRLNADDLKRIHGLNERILVNNYRQAISFYYRLIKNANL
ncbi:MAG: M20/M25/M40 family metallo-hydrolase, partial [Bacteroidota bacterium]